MNQVYGNISLVTGPHDAGICVLQIAPKEWVDYFPPETYATGTINAEITLQDGRNWLSLQLAPDSVTFTEKPKATKGLTYYDVSISGLCNDLSAAQRQILETLRSHEFVCITTDAQGRKRVTGNKETGVTPSFYFSQSNKSEGLLEVGVEFSMLQAYLSPFYTA